jgi:formylglycine-generating enzyme required for sulfatase activity
MLRFRFHLGGWRAHGEFTGRDDDHLTGKPYRLLSESEWEYAARAGSTTRFSVGDAISPSQANFDGSDDGSGPSEINRQKTLPVGSFAPNGFGLYDMQDNVAP